jgi:hypothetical protein
VIGWNNPDPEIAEVLKQLGRKIGAEFVEGDYQGWGSIQCHGRVFARVGPWTVSFGLYSISGRYPRAWTEVHVPYVNPDGYRFLIAPESFASEIGKKLGLLQEVQVGARDIDDAFFIRANDEEKARAFFDNARLRLLMLEQPWFCMESKETPWPLDMRSQPGFPPNVDLLCFWENKVITDVDRLKGLFDVFTLSLEQLCKIGSALREPPGLELRGNFSTPPVVTGPPRAPLAPAAERPLGTPSATPPGGPGTEGASSAPTAHTSPGRSVLRFGCFGCSTIFTLIVGLLLLGIVGVLIPNWKANNLYVPGSCVVIDKRLKESDSPDPDKKMPAEYSPQIKIRYEVAGRSYETWTYEANPWPSTDRDVQQAIIDNFEVGETYPCWYDPAHPEAAVLARQGHLGYFLGMLGSFTAFLLVGLAGVWISWRVMGPHRAGKTGRTATVASGPGTEGDALPAPWSMAGGPRVQQTMPSGSPPVAVGQSTRSAIRAGVLATFTVVFVLACLLVCGALLLAVPNWRANNRYVAGTCEVLDKKLAKGAFFRGGVAYKPDIKIRYEVNGRKYVLWTYEAINSFDRDQPSQQAIVDGYRVGSTYPCWYDPEHPESAVLVRRPHEWIKAFLVFMCGLIVLSGTGLIIAWCIKIPARRLS